MTQTDAQPDQASPDGNGPYVPKIVAFCCHYCAYTAADMAGASRIAYPPNIRIVRVPCSGRIDVPAILEAFVEGADGVYVAGCLDGDCHFIHGNTHAKRRIAQAKGCLTEVGLEPERLEMFQLSAAMGGRFAEIATEMTERIQNLGPSPVRAAKPHKEPEA